MGRLQVRLHLRSFQFQAGHLALSRVHRAQLRTGGTQGLFQFTGLPLKQVDFGRERQPFGGKRRQLGQHSLQPRDLLVEGTFLIRQVPARLPQVVVGAAVLIHPQQWIKDPLALARRQQEGRRKAPLRHSDGIAEQILQISLGIDAQVLMHPGTYLVDAFSQHGPSVFAIVHPVACGAALTELPLNLIGALVQRGADGDDHRARCSALAQQIPLACRRNVIKEREPNGFQQGAFAGAVLAQDGVCPEVKAHFGAGIALEVLQFHRVDQHQGRSPLSFGSPVASSSASSSAMIS